MFLWNLKDFQGNYFGIQFLSTYYNQDLYLKTLIIVLDICLFLIHFLHFQLLFFQNYTNVANDPSKKVTILFSLKIKVFRFVFKKKTFYYLRQGARKTVKIGNLTGKKFKCF